MNLLRGLTFLAVIIVDTLLACVVLYPIALVRALCARTGLSAGARAIGAGMNRIIDAWVGSNALLLRWLRITRLDVVVEDPAALLRDRWYLVLCNHQTWADIIVLQSLFSGRLPPLKFFTKQQLLWIPLFGVALWLLGFPIVRRLSREAIERRPELASRDREATLRACERFLEHPTAVLNFVEGTRFTPAKHAAQQTRFRHLLNPKLGGVSYVVSALSAQIHRVLDVTLVYPSGVPTFWDFLCGRCPQVQCHVRVLPLPSEVHSAGDPDHVRAALAPLIEGLWQDKDQRIALLRADSG
jgi:1-acyl-sn-glycerol-3-phosphate acyltransferase